MSVLCRQRIHNMIDEERKKKSRSAMQVEREERRRESRLL
jgi:hypothetical protein